ncbi:MAG: hypothetical protein ACE1Z4_10660 [Gammaproteobacteria bacterium]
MNDTTDTNMADDMHAMNCAIGDLETAVMKRLDVLEAKLDDLLQRTSP